MQNAEAVMADADWRDHALMVRNAVLCMRGAPDGDPLAADAGCLPSEADDCGHSNVEHIIGWYAQLGAMMAHNSEHLAATLGSAQAVRELYVQAYESFMCAAAATPGECWHWRDMHGECPGPMEHT